MPQVRRIPGFLDLAVTNIHRRDGRVAEYTGGLEQLWTMWDKRGQKESSGGERRILEPEQGRDRGPGFRPPHWRRKRSELP